MILYTPLILAWFFVSHFGVMDIKESRFPLTQGRNKKVEYNFPCNQAQKRVPFTL